MKAERMQAEDVDRYLENTSRAYQTAAKIIQKAQDEAAALKHEMQAELSAHHDHIANLAKQEGARFIDAEKLRRNAEATVSVMASAAAVKERLEGLTPWLCDLMELCLLKICGGIPQQDLLPSLVRQAVGDYASAQEIVLKCAPTALSQLEDLKEAFPVHFSGVVRISADPTLSDEEIVLSGEGGITRIHLVAQISALREALDAAIMAEVAR